MSPASAWTDEEHDILVGAANKQIELENKDEKKEVPWTKLWQQVTVTLREHGYNRSPGACNCYWKRIVASEMATEEAAGPEWADEEHDILVSVTDAQLAAEADDPTLQMSWEKLWKKVSTQLKKSGYTRSILACEAHWILIESNPQVINKFADRIKKLTPEDDVEMDFEETSDEDIPPVARKPAKSPKWTLEEDWQLKDLRQAAMKSYRETYGSKEAPESWLWNIVAQSLHQAGHDKSSQDCRKRWNEHEMLMGKRSKSPRNIVSASTSTTSNQSNVSLMWSPVNALEDNPLNPSSETSTPKADEDSEPPVQNSLLEDVEASSKPSLVVKLATRPELLANLVAKAPVRDPQMPGVAAESAQVEIILPDDEEIQDIGTNSVEKRQRFIPEAAVEQSPGPTRRKHKKNRFNLDQRAVLDAEVSENGPSPDLSRRKELAIELGVEEVVIRNWFLNFRAKRARESLDAHNSMSASPAPEISIAPMESRKKRAQVLLATDERDSVEESHDNDMHAAKKARLDPMPSATESEPPRINVADSNRSSTGIRNPSLPEESHIPQPGPQSSERPSVPEPVQLPPVQIPPLIPSHLQQSEFPQPTRQPAKELQPLTPTILTAPVPFIGNHGLKYENGPMYSTQFPRLASRSPVSNVHMNFVLRSQEHSPAPTNTSTSPYQEFFPHHQGLPPVPGNLSQAPTGQAPSQFRRSFPYINDASAPNSDRRINLPSTPSATAPKPLNSQPPPPPPRTPAPFIAPTPFSAPIQNPPTPTQTPTPTPAPTSEHEEAAWAQQKVNALRASITSLETTNTHHNTLLRTLSLSLQDTDVQRTNVLRTTESRIAQAQKEKEAEIARVIKEIEERSRKEVALMVAECENVCGELERRKGDVEREKGEVGDRVRKNEMEIKRKKVGLVRFEGLVEYYTSGGGDGDDVEVL